MTAGYSENIFAFHNYSGDIFLLNTKDSWT